MRSKIVNRIFYLFFAIAFMFCTVFTAACLGDRAKPEGGTPPPEGGTTPPDGGTTPPDGGTTNPNDIHIEYGDVIEGSAPADADILQASGNTLTAVGIGETTCTVDGKVKKVIVTPAVVDVVLFTGQSNMVGRETDIYTVDIPQGQAYEYKYLTKTLDAVQNPSGERIKNGVTENSGSTSKPSEGGSSIVPQFCYDYVTKTKRKIVAVHAAKGGQQISYFVPGNASNMYPVLTEKYNECVTYLTDSPNFDIGKRFYIMFQGESDSLESTSKTITPKETYKQRFMSFHNGVKETCGIEFGGLIQTGRNSNISYEGIVSIAQVKNEIAWENDDIIMLDQEPICYFTTHPYGSSDSYMISDNLHYNQYGLRKIASDSCAALVNYLGYGDADKKGVDPIEYLAMPNEVASFSLGTQDTMCTLFSTTQAVNYTFTGTQCFATLSNPPADTNHINPPATIEPIDSRIVWESSDDSIATVENGVITAKQLGTVTITAYPVNHSEMISTATVKIQEDKANTTYRWDFENDANGIKTHFNDDGVATAGPSTVTGTKQGDGTTTIADGTYTSTNRTSTYKLKNETITLTATADWSIKWKGKCDIASGNNAAILFAGDSHFFITYQYDRGIFVRFGTDQKGLVFIPNITDTQRNNWLKATNEWELRHSKADNMVTLYVNGEYVNSLAWLSQGKTVSMKINSLFGRTDTTESAAFCGTLEYMQIKIYDNPEADI